LNIVKTMIIAPNVIRASAKLKTNNEKLLIFRCR
jgi:hypothetical protein